MKQEKGKEVISTYNKLKTAREPLEKYWRDAFDFSYPLRGQGFSNTSDDGIMNAASAKEKQARIYDSTATDACRLLASSMISGLTPNTAQWFSLSIPNVPDASIPRNIRAWLQASSETLHSMIHGSNYNAQAFEFFIDMAVAGQCGLYIERPDTGGLYFEHWTLASLYCQDTMRGEGLDTVYRRLTLTVYEAANKFGANALPEQYKQMLKDDPFSDKPLTMIHTIRPRLVKGKQTAGKLKQSLPFESIYVCAKSGEIISESGYHEFPAVIPRWMTIPETDYAVGPLNDALPDIKTVNAVVEMTLQNAEMAIAGTYVAKDDGVINANTIRIGPRKIIMARDVDNIKGLPAAGNFNIAAVEIQRLQGQIKRVMMSDELSPSDRPQMTAEEVRTRTQLIRQILGPVFGRLQSEFLNPLIRRCFGLAYRAGDLGQPPREIEKFNFIPEYKSPLARAQRFDELTAMDKFEGHMAQTMQYQPNVSDLYDLDKAIQKRSELLGIPAELIRETKDVEQIRRQRAEQQQAQQQQEMAMVQQQQEVVE